MEMNEADRQRAITAWSNVLREAGERLREAMSPKQHLEIIVPVLWELREDDPADEEPLARHLFSIWDRETGEVDMDRLDPRYFDDGEPKAWGPNPDGWRA
jgi:hypothetical protein